MAKCSLDNCNEDCFENSDKCILHCDKYDWYVELNNKKDWTKSQKSINLFWNVIQKHLNDLHDQSTYEPATLDFTLEYKNVLFPQFQKDIEYCPFADNQVDMGTNFYSYEIFDNNDTQHRNHPPYPEVNHIFEKLNIIFDNCTFLDNADFKRYTLSKEIIFDNIKFDNGIKLNKNYTEDVVFNNCIFNNIDIHINNIKFDNIFKFEECKVEKKFNISNNNFKKIASFRKSVFNTTNFENVVFKDIVSFKETAFKGSVNFEDTIFSSIAIFKKTFFLDSLNLENAIIKGELTFLDTMIVSLKNRETARIIKYSYEQQNNIIESNNFYIEELKLRKKELKPFKQFLGLITSFNIIKFPFISFKISIIPSFRSLLDYIIFTIHGVTSSHSHNWFKALLWILIVAFFHVVHISDFNFIESILYNIMIENNLLDKMANSINIINLLKSDNISFTDLFFKILIGYLIYQFIVSVRQNTRRK